jgi:PhnB protein
MTTSIAPWLSVREGKKAVSYYKAAFGAEERHRVDGEGGAIVVAQLAIDGAGFWVGEDSDFSPVGPGGGTVRMILTVADPDAVFARAVQAGATVVAAVYEDHGWRIGRVADPFGHHWEIGKPL